MKIEISYKETPGGDLPYLARIKYLRGENRVTMQRSTWSVPRWFVLNLKKLVEKYGRAEKVEIVGEAPLLRNEKFAEFLRSEIMEAVKE